MWEQKKKEKVEGNKVSVQWIEGKCLHYLLHKMDEQGCRLSPGTQSSWLQRLQMTGTSLEHPGQLRKKPPVKKPHFSDVWNDILQKSVLGRHVTFSLRHVQVRSGSPKYCNYILGLLNQRKIKPTRNNKYYRFRPFFLLCLKVFRTHTLKLLFPLKNAIWLLYFSIELKILWSQRLWINYIWAQQCNH